MQLLSKIMGDPNKKELKVIQPLIVKINALEPTIKKLSDEELTLKTAEFRDQLHLSLKGGLVLENALIQLLREVLEKVEPLAEKCTESVLRRSLSAFRLKLDRNPDLVDALSTYLQDTLSEGFEQAYEKLSPILNTFRVQAVMDLAESRQSWPDEASNPQNATRDLLIEVEPTIKEISDEDFSSAFTLAWSQYEQDKENATDLDEVANSLLEKMLHTVLRRLQSELNALKADEIDTQLPALVKKSKQGKTLEDLLPEAFAVVREAGWRTIEKRHYDVQLIGGVVLHQGKIAEMRTGEGKTLVATAPVYLNALTGKGVHVITVNDYLAKRDSEWMGQIFRFLGLTVGVVTHTVEPLTGNRRLAYQADITYGTNNEFGFDYLRDNMVTSIDQMVQRELNFAVVDEVDNILIDEARTPLIISGQGQESTDQYARFAQWAPRLKEDLDYTVEAKTRTVLLTEPGIEKIEKLAGIENIYSEENIDLTRYMENALKAEIIFKRDHDYIVKDGEVVIVDEFTGRQMPGRRYSEGLHQAIEAKEGVKVQRENHTLATITFQNYFRLYEKLSGMTGTAITEAEEFHKIYKLDVVVIPTNRPMVRKDMSDLIYRGQDAKYRAVVEEIKEKHEEGRPVLVGTTSVETSEKISQLLETEGIPHSVLNAKHHEREAQIVAQAGRSGAVTIATNMAGRGTDIVLGGNAEGFFETIIRQHVESVPFIREIGQRTQDEREEREEAIQEYIENMTEEEKEQLFQDKIKECEEDHDKVVTLGGLHILGTERHESRRIDNQLRGRAGRQGDPGSSRFFLALDDELMRRFAAERVGKVMERFGMDEDTPLESGMISRFIEGAQTRVEGYNFDIRKNVVEYDDVIAEQRRVIYTDRQAVLEQDDMHERILDMIRAEVASMVDALVPTNHIEDEDQLEQVFKSLEVWFPIPGELVPENLHSLHRDQFIRDLQDVATAHYQQRGSELKKQVEEQGGEQNIDPQRDLERTYLLQVIDRLWMDHIDSLDVMRAGIGLRSVGQRDPLVEFKNEAYRMFDQLKSAIQRNVVDLLMRMLRNEPKIQIQRNEPPRPQQDLRNLRTNEDVIAKASGQVKNEASQLERSNGGKSQNSSKSSKPSNSPRPSNVSNLKIGRNDPCPCGSGKKYKKCHGAS